MKILEQKNKQQINKQDNKSKNSQKGKNIKNYIFNL